MTESPRPPADSTDVSDLITVAQAIAIIDGAAVAPRSVEMPLDEAHGLRLVDDLPADRDYPPFDKSLMDGYAVRSEDVASLSRPVIGRARVGPTGPVALRVAGEIAAGGEPTRGIGPGETMAVMTGAPLPSGADGVVPIEDVERGADATVEEGGSQSIRILRANSPARYVGRRGSDVPAGTVVLPAGTTLGPAQLAVAATVGAARVRVYARPRVAVLTTGNELIPPGTTPGPSQIRDSNGILLRTLLARRGCDVIDLGIVRDDPAAIRAALERGLTHDALFVTGGMSVGTYDYVPRLLADIGVDLRITKLRLKPGKPFVFGVHRHAAGTAGSDADTPRESFVFGLPGNPVSGFVCTVRLATRLLTRLAGGVPQDRWVSGRLETGLTANGPREFYQPVQYTVAGGSRSAQNEIAAVKPLEWKGSADVFTLAMANALLVRAENEPPVPKGTLVRVLEV